MSSTIVSHGKRVTKASVPSYKMRDASAPIAEVAESKPGPPAAAITLTAESVQEQIRLLLSGTPDEVKRAIGTIYSASHDQVSMELFITNSGIPPLLRQACRHQKLSESSRALRLLFQLFLNHHQIDIADKIIAVTRVKSLPLEQKNALRLLLAFVYVMPLPDIHPAKSDIVDAIKETFTQLLRHLWYGSSLDVALSLDCLSFISVTPAYLEPLMSLMETPLPKPVGGTQLSRASTYLNVSHEPSSLPPQTSPRRSSWLNIRRQSAKLLESGLGMLKDMLTVRTPTVYNGVNGLAHIATVGTLTEREAVTVIVLEWGKHDRVDDVQSVCAGFCKALVSKLGDTDVADIHKIQAISCIEQLVQRDGMRLHLLEAGLSPELYLLVQLGTEGPRHHAERVLAALLEKPDVAEFFKPPE
ncbi:hypothetical protein LEN26_010370 [Aphanomyces euteiches]|nr:hypothetical protein LEN26_010370 [Aphanomyces euteiches]